MYLSRARPGRIPMLRARLLITRSCGFAPGGDVLPSGSGRHGPLGPDFHDREGFSVCPDSKVFVIMKNHLLRGLTMIAKDLVLPAVQNPSRS